ncbi:MAG: SusE domain-containing protein [Bacteroidota bacterium]|nr:SusE domain-containing protein [Bacteroidota bacterium]
MSKKLFSTLIACMVLLSFGKAMTVLSPKTDTVIHLGGERGTIISFYADRAIDYLYFGKAGFNPASALMSYSLFGQLPAQIQVDQLAQDIVSYIDPSFAVGKSITLEWTAGYVKPDNSTAYATNKLKIKFIRDYFFDEPHPYSLLIPANKSVIDIAGPDNNKSLMFRWSKAITDSMILGSKSKVEYNLFIDSQGSDFVSDPTFLYQSNKLTDTFLSMNYTDLYSSVIQGMGVQKSKSITVKWHILGYCQDCTPQDPVPTQDFELTFNYIYGVGIEAVSTTKIGVYNSNDRLYIANPNNEQMKTLEVMDLQGKVVFNRPLNFGGANMILELPSELSNELYIWKVNYQSGQVSGKFIINK